MSPVCVARQLLRLTVKTDTHTYRQALTHTCTCFTIRLSPPPLPPPAIPAHLLAIILTLPSRPSGAWHAPHQERRRKCNLNGGCASRHAFVLAINAVGARCTLHPAPSSPFPRPCSLLVLAAPCLPMESTASRGSCFEFDDAVCGLSKVFPDPPSSTATRFLLLP